MAIEFLGKEFGVPEASLLGATPLYWGTGACAGGLLPHFHWWLVWAPEVGPGALEMREWVGDLGAGAVWDFQVGGFFVKIESPELEGDCWRDDGKRYSVVCCLQYGYLRPNGHRCFSHGEKAVLLFFKREITLELGVGKPLVIVSGYCFFAFLILSWAVVFGHVSHFQCSVASRSIFSLPFTLISHSPFSQCT